MNLKDRFLKRSFDVLFSFVGILLSSWIVIPAYIIAALDTGNNGFFFHERVGMNGRIFRLIKIRTMKQDDHMTTTVTTTNDPRITRIGMFFRKYKIDELPQLINVFIGDMSFVGPRPDVPGFADTLQGEDRIVLGVRPGITGPATLKYRNEEAILARQSDPERYNREVIWPDKVAINKQYVLHYSFIDDIRYIGETLFSSMDHCNSARS